MATTSVQLSDRFPKGTKGELSVLAGSVIQPGGPQKETTAGEDGVIKFSGCDVGAQYVIKVTGEGWAAQYAIQAKDESFDEDANLHRDGPEATRRRLQADRQAQADARAKAEKADPLVASPAPGKTVTSNKPDRRTPSVAEPQPGPRQQETSGPQRSDTPDGLGTPKDPRESVPDVRQEDVPKSTPQRSSTETGVAAVKDPGEQVPAARQEDVPASTPQRSSTESGTAEPKPKVRSAQKRDDSSANRARGRTRTKAEENVKPKRTVKQTTRTGTAKRAKSTKRK